MKEETESHILSPPIGFFLFSCLCPQWTSPEHNFLDIRKGRQGALGNLLCPLDLNHMT